MSKFEIIKNEKTTFIKNPDKLSERNTFIKKGFSYVKNDKLLKIPNNFVCIYQHKKNPEGGLCGSGCSIHEWSVFNKLNKLVAKISIVNDGDYSCGDLIEWL